MGYLTFSIAWNLNEGICVDTHVHRISNRLGWVNTWHAKSNGPERTRKELELMLPKELWGDVNQLLVGFGQTLCFARNPLCDSCTLWNDHFLYYKNPKPFEPKQNIEVGSS